MKRSVKKAVGLGGEGAISQIESSTENLCKKLRFNRLRVRVKRE